MLRQCSRMSNQWFNQMCVFMWTKDSSFGRPFSEVQGGELQARGRRRIFFQNVKIFKIYLKTSILERVVDILEFDNNFLN